MIKLLTDLPDGVVGLEASGQITGEDYESVVIPAVEAALQEHAKINLLYVLGAGFEGFELAAAWDDAKLGLSHLTAWDRAAVVTDAPWVRNVSRAFGFLFPCRMRLFSNDQLAEARSWVSEPADAPGRS